MNSNTPIAIIQQNKKICIIGTGGFGREVLCCIDDIISPSGYNITEHVCFMETDNQNTNSSIMGVKIISLSDFNPTKHFVSIAVGSPSVRKKIVQLLPSETNFANIIHPNTTISKWVELEEGCIITAGTILTCNIKIGKHAHLNLNTTIGHDCNIGDYFTTAPGANISGNCNFGNQVYFGTNASVKQGISICNNVTIGMAAVVTKNITEEGIYIGNPLKKLIK